MKHPFFFWLYLSILAGSFMACTRSSYPTATTSTASIRNTTEPTSLRSVSSIDLAVPPVLATTQPVVSPLLGTVPRLHGHPTGYGHRAASGQPAATVLRPHFIATKNERLTVATKPRTANTAAKTDFDGAVSVFYTMLIAGIVVVLAALVLLLVRWLKKRKARA